MKRKCNKVPVWHKYVLSVEEAATYFRIGETKLRNIIAQNETANFILRNGNRYQIKRELFENFIDGLSCI